MSKAIGIIIALVATIFAGPLVTYYYAFFATLVIDIFKFNMSLTIHQLAGISYILGFAFIGILYSIFRVEKQVEAIQESDTLGLLIKSIVYLIIAPPSIWLLSTIYSWYFM